MTDTQKIALYTASAKPRCLVFAAAERFTAKMLEKWQRNLERKAEVATK